MRGVLVPLFWMAVWFIGIVAWAAFALSALPFGAAVTSTLAVGLGLCLVMIPIERVYKQERAKSRRRAG